MHRIRLSYLVILLSVPLLSSTPAARYDAVLKGGLVFDGTGAPPFTADIAVRNGRIAGIGSIDASEAVTVVDASGLAVMPGFIDIHSHASGVTLEASGIYHGPGAHNLIRQGVTTIIGGQDGRSPIPVGSFLDGLEARRPAVNFGILAGHGSIRYLVMRHEAREPTGAELHRMRSMLETALKEGAWGLSSGLEYDPGRYASTDELTALAEVVARYDALYLTHIRNEADGVVAAVQEAVRTAEGSGARTQITHHAVHGRRNWGASTETLAAITAAQHRGVEISVDQFPYTHVSGSSTFFFPEWAMETTAAGLEDLAGEPASRRRLLDHIALEITEGVGGGDPAQIYLSFVPWNRALGGRTIAGLLAERDMEASVENAALLVLELQLQGGFHCFLPVLSEADIRNIMSHPRTVIASDAGTTSFGSGWPHPASYGTFPKVIGHYARDLGLLSVEEAVRRMTGLPAEILGLADRGTIRSGAFADLVVVELEHVADRASYARPHEYPSGILHVMVNGEWVVSNEAVTGTRPGRILRRQNP